MARSLRCLADHRLVALGLPQPWRLLANVVYGGLFSSRFVGDFHVGGLIEAGFAIIRNHEINEGFLVRVCYCLSPCRPPFPYGKWRSVSLLA